MLRLPGQARQAVHCDGVEHAGAPVSIDAVTVQANSAVYTNLVTLGDFIDEAGVETVLDAKPLRLRRFVDIIDDQIKFGPSGFVVGE